MVASNGESTPTGISTDGMPGAVSVYVVAGGGTRAGDAAVTAVADACWLGVGAMDGTDSPSGLDRAALSPFDRFRSPLDADADDADGLRRLGGRTAALA